MSTPQVLLEVAKRYHRDGRLDEADAAYRQVLAVEPANAPALHLYALLLQARRRQPEAIDAVRRAIAAEPNNAAYRVTLAKMLLAAGDPANAAAAYEHAVALAPADPAAWLGLGLARHEQGQIDGAIEAYERASTLQPKGSETLELLLANARRGLFFGLGSGFQGAHAPERQVFMSAAVSLLRDCPGPISILEIGSYLGASALTWAQAIETLTGRAGRILCIDTWSGGHLDAEVLSSDAPLAEEMVRYLAGSETAYRIFQANIAAAAKSVAIEHRRGPSADIVPRLDAAAFDLVYVDGSHRYDEVVVDIRNADRVLRDGGFLCGDDLELQADDCDRGNAERHRQDDFVVDPRTGTSFHPGVTLAVADGVGRVSTYSGFWIMRKTAGGYRPVDLQSAEGLLPAHWPRSIVDALRSRFSASGELRGVRG